MLDQALLCNIVIFALVIPDMAVLLIVIHILLCVIFLCALALLLLLEQPDWVDALCLRSDSSGLISGGRGLLGCVLCEPSTAWQWEHRAQVSDAAVLSPWSLSLLQGSIRRHTYICSMHPPQRSVMIYAYCLSDCTLSRVTGVLTCVQQTLVCVRTS